MFQCFQAAVKAELSLVSNFSWCFCPLFGAILVFFGIGFVMLLSTVLMV